MKNHNLDMKFLEGFLVKSELASDRLSFLSKMGLKFFSAGLEFFWKRKKRAWLTNKRFKFQMNKKWFGINSKYLNGSNRSKMFKVVKTGQKGLQIILPSDVINASLQLFVFVSTKCTAKQIGLKLKLHCSLVNCLR